MLENVCVVSCFCKPKKKENRAKREYKKKHETCKNSSGDLFLFDDV